MEQGIYVAIIIVLTLALLGVFISLLISLLLAPIVSTPKNIRSEIMEKMDLKRGEILLDLGSGYGIFLIEAAKKYGVKGFGYEISPAGIFISRIIKLFKPRIRKNIVIVPKNFLERSNLPVADKIYCFLSSKAMKSVYKRLLKEEIDENIKIYSYRYPFPEVREKKKEKLSDNNYLYIYDAKSFNRG